MKKVPAIAFIFLFSVLRMSAIVWHTVNVDTKTEAAMQSAYTSQYLIEKGSEDELEKIMKHYTNAEVATAGIFASKWLDRKAMKNAGGFSDIKKNHYYKRIYSLVSKKIMPKIYDVATLCVKYPDKAIYWGPYLFKVTEDVRNLCMQFETVVCNGKIGFEDIPFYCISDKFKPLFDLAQLGDVDWEEVWNKICEFPSGISKEDLTKDFNSLMDLGAAIANAGSSAATDIYDDMSGASTSLVSGKVTDLMTAYNKFEEIYGLISNPENIKALVLECLVSTDSTGVSNLLSIDGYNIGRYLTQYWESAKGEYYKQRWYIEGESNEETEEIYAEHSASFSDCYHCIIYRYDGTEAHRFNLTESEKERIKEQSLYNFGWSSSKIDELNRAGSDKYYAEFYDLQEYLCDADKDSGDLYGFAYSVRIIRKRKKAEVVYEEVFDSYNMNINVFLAHMNSLVDEYNSNQTQSVEGGINKDETNPIRYVLKSDEKIYYEESDEKKLRGCDKVSYILKCDHGNELGKGSFSWKENGSHNHSDVRDDTRSYAMLTSLSPSSPTVEVDMKLVTLQKQKSETNTQIGELKEKNNSLLRLISTSSVEDQKKYREQYNSNLSQITNLESDLDRIESEIKQYNEAKDQILEDSADEMDEYWRIPAIMEEASSGYNIKWLDEGSWSGSTFTRNGTLLEESDGIVKFIANLKVLRGESHMLGIRTHRAIISVEWVLKANYSSVNILEVMTLPNELSDGEKTEKVNERHRQWMEEYSGTGCIIEIEYSYGEDYEASGDTDEIHLLWMSDRLRVARNIDFRLSEIYAHLLLTEKFIRQNENVKSYLYGMLFGGLPTSVRNDVCGKSFKRWQTVAFQIASGIKPKEVTIDDI